MATSVACAFFFYAEPVGETSLPALDACALCAKPLARDSDIFMYRGDTPFCSEECRYEQMQPDAIRARKAARSAGRRQQYSERSLLVGTKTPGRCPWQAKRPEAGSCISEKNSVCVNKI